jgi:hypothetical protein
VNLPFFRRQQPEMSIRKNSSDDAFVILGAIIFWAIFSFIITNFMQGIFPAQPPLIVGANLFQGPLALWTPFVRYDSIHYMRIINGGYGVGNLGLRAFFPGFPLCIRFLSWPVFAWTHERTFSSVLTGIWVNLALLLVSLCAIKKIYETDLKGKNGWIPVLLLLAQPYAFYYLAFYAESLFLFLTVSAFFFALRKKWWIAALLAGAASATRLQGILLFPAFIIEYLHQKDWKLRNLRPDCLWLALCPWGLAAYLASIGGVRAYLKEASVWPQRILNWNVFYPLWHYFQKSIEQKAFDFSDTVAVLMIVSALFLLLYGFRKLRPSFLFYTVLSMAMPMITTVVQAVGRYYGVIFPLYLAAGFFFEKRPVAFYITIIIFGILSGLCMGLFTAGFWVA